MKKKASPQQQPKAEKKQPRKISDRIYLLVAFFEGSAVIAVELLGAKMLAPYYGNSLPIWTAVIGVTIGFLTVGYFIGGRLATKNHLPRILSYAFSLGAFFVALMPLLIRQLFLLAQGMSLYAGCTLVAVLLLGPPLLCLGSTSPLIIQQLTRQVQQAGKKAGLVYAVSTLGGILFTFLLGFAIIPEFGIGRPLLFFSIALLIISLFLYFEKKQLIVLAATTLLFAFSFRASVQNDSGFFSILYNSEGMLGQLKVVEEANVDTEGLNRFLLINGIGQTNMINMAKYHMGYSGWMYVHKISMMASLKRNCQNTLLLGFGAGMIATELKQLNMKVDAVDFDKRMLMVAKKYFYYDDPKLTFILDDARHYLRTAKKKYDLIVFDVLNGDTQPSYIFTMESFAELKNLLSDSGMVIIEFQEDSANKGYSMYQSICNTLLASGYKTYYNYGDDILIAASLKEIDASGYKIENLTPCCHAQSWASDFIKNPFIKCERPFANGMILTDDRPVIDVINAETIKSWRIRAINSFSKNLLNSNQRIFN